jgi:hypothetical protein
VEEVLGTVGAVEFAAVVEEVPEILVFVLELLAAVEEGVDSPRFCNTGALSESVVVEGE